MVISAQQQDSAQNKKPLPIQKIQALVHDDLIKVNAAIESLGGSKEQLIHDITSRLVRSGGKRLRPILTLITAQLCHYQGDHHIDLAAAVECMHTATLLHDDVVDGSSTRRGQETANALWNNQSSVLVGDFLLGHAFCLMVNAGHIEVLRILSKASAIIAEGEVKQLLATNNLAMSKEKYIDIITAKTATLFSAACEIMPVLAEKSQEEITSLRNFGLNLGIAFQIVDDILDYASDQINIGKDLGNDFKEGKVTLPIIIAYQQANTTDQQFLQRTFQDHHQQDGDFETVLSILNRYEAIEHSKKAAQFYINEAKDNLSVFSPSEPKSILIELLDFSLNRIF